jgi:hypothetical protein
MQSMIRLSTIEKVRAGKAMSDIRIPLALNAVVSLSADNFPKTRSDAIKMESGTENVRINRFRQPIRVISSPGVRPY